MKLIKKNIFNILLVTTLLVIVLVPDAKAFFLKGLMEIGLYSPKTEEIIPVLVNLDGIKFKDEKGKIIDLSDLKGKVIFLNFWATWCPPCRAEMPSLNKLYSLFKNDPNVVFIFADADGDLVKSAKFMLNRKFEMPVYKVESNIPEQIFAGSLPTTVIFDKQGRLSFRHEGITDYSDKKFVAFLGKLKEAK
ncbi:TlpA family protein disulfide reductase [Pedobacter fastidiosus]|uniref:TlpA family protein disulfide reductase n=1 Tax=Pedobacter fastidiosus TaxID=2765361 RepID=A0ABR7KUK3_9SPHI|nr:TlpA disulfide reductase family protein [Pedobacter fastidiosus]MBC6111794.1 TlpA family protein disulfide reductase [Pedobacter fastidiosus]